TPGASIHYTTDGSEPTLADPGVASGQSISINSSVFLRAKAFVSGIGASATKSAVFQVGVQVAAGHGHSILVDADGDVWSWGDNSQGQLGDASTTDRAQPTSIFDLEDIVSVAAGSKHSMALKSDGTVWVTG